MVMVSTISLCLSGCSFANLSETSSIKPEPETVIVKETVIVTETVFVTEPDSEEKVGKRLKKMILRKLPIAKDIQLRMC